MLVIGKAVTRLGRLHSLRATNSLAACCTKDTTGIQSTSPMLWLPRRLFAASPKKKARCLQEKQGITSGTNIQFKKITVALVGRPNVGKSSLFNRLAQHRAAIVHSTPGTTRDWKEATGRLGELEFVIMDTSGLEDRKAANAIENKMLQHTEVAIKHADVVLFVVDARSGVSADDEKFARWVKQRRPQGGVHLIANKMEGWGSAQADIKYEETLQECYRLGLGDPVPSSGEHGDGLQDLYQVLEPYARVEAPQPVESLPAPDPAPEPEDALVPVAEDEALANLPTDPRKRKMVLQRLQRAAAAIQIAIVGRPNVGKSTLINQLLGEERVLSGPTPGLTRDVTTVEFSVQGREVRLVDTAGMRRYGAWDLSTPLEGEAVGMAKKALERSHVVVLVIDGSGGTAEGLTNDKIRFAPRDLLESGGRESDALGSPEPSDKKSDAIARVAAKVAGSAASRAEKGELVAPAPGDAPVRASREGMGRPFGMTRQDLSIAEQILDEGRGVVIVLNKLDASGNPEDVARIVRGQMDGMHQGKGTELVPIAALRGKGMEELLPAVLRTYDRWNVRVPTGRLNSWLALNMRTHPAPSVNRIVGYKGRGHDRKAVTVPVQLKIKYVAQVASRPPTFTVWANRPDVPDAYRRFLVNSLREEFGLGGTPIRLNVRAAENPFAAKGRQSQARRTRRVEPRMMSGSTSGSAGTSRAESGGRSRPGRDVGVAAGYGASVSQQGPAGGRVRPRRTEKADEKRAAYSEATASRSDSDSSRPSRTRPAGPRPLPAQLSRMAKSASLSGGRVARLPRKILKKLQEDAENEKQ